MFSMQLTNVHVGRELKGSTHRFGTVTALHIHAGVASSTKLHCKQSAEADGKHVCHTCDADSESAAEPNYRAVSMVGAGVMRLIKCFTS